MKFDVIRAWKDQSYRQTLNEEQRDALPAHPSGNLELSDDELQVVFGGGHSIGAASASNTTVATGNASILSYALICEINVFSLDVEILRIDLLSIGDEHCTWCVHHD